MRKKLTLILLLATMVTASACGTNNSNNSNQTANNTKQPETQAASQANTEPKELKGDIVFWHSFTQGARKDFIDKAAAEFTAIHPEVNITIETFAWSEFYTKWTTGLRAGQVPDISTALPNHVVEMLDADALVSIDDVIDNIGRDRFYEAPLTEGAVDGISYSLPLYSHAQVMWYRKDLLDQAGLKVPTTWQELSDAAVALNDPPNVYGLSVPMGSNDLLGTRFLNFYVRSAGETLITEDGKANLTSKAALDGIKYWTDLYKKVSPEGSANFVTLDQSTLFYQGKTAFDFNSGFHIGGVETNSPHLLDYIGAAPIPTVEAGIETPGIETSNIPLVVWKNSKHQDISKAFIEFIYEDDRYIEFLHSVPGGMLPAMKDIVENEKFTSNATIQKFGDSVKVISEAVNKGTAIGMEYGPKLQSGIITSQGVIEKMLQEIVLLNGDIEQSAKDAEKELNSLFGISQ
jgi:multiple sugar transport system substrate-binding protein